jgi:hypothetical protein
VVKKKGNFFRFVLSVKIKNSSHAFHISVFNSKKFSSRLNFDGKKLAKIKFSNVALDRWLNEHTLLK